MLARNAHLAGLVALLDSYGKTLLKDRTGLFLFTEIRRQIVRLPRLEMAIADHTRFQVACNAPSLSPSQSLGGRIE